MLVEFKVSNFRSFKNEQVFSMQTGKRLTKYRDTNTMTIEKEKLLKSALLFGANANGKTNLITALLELQRLIVSPTTDEIERIHTDSFGYNKKNTSFEITFIKNKNIYDYILEYNSKEIVREILISNKKIVFKRNRQKITHIPNQLVPISNNIRKNQLLLYFAQQNNEKQSKEAYSWFVEDLMLVNTTRMRRSKFKALENRKFKNRFLHFLQAADFNIIDVEIKERVKNVPNFKNFIQKKLNSDEDDLNDVDLNDVDLVPQKIYDVYCKHKSERGSFSIYFPNESTGTKVFMFLALYILSNSKKTLLIDEFDRSYHLELAKALLSLINSTEQTNQFILTTHELSLMDCKLRQDQIWFAEKNRFGESELFSLFDFDDSSLKRSDFNYKKRYLEGRYGATQIVNSELLMEALKENE